MTPLPPSPKDSKLRIEVGYKTMLVAGAVVGLGWVLLQLWPILLVIVVSLMIAGALAPPISWLEAKRVPRGAAIAMVFVGMFLVAALFLVLTVPQLVSQASDIIDRWPTTQAELATQLDKHHLTAPLARSVRGTGSSDLIAKVAETLFGYSRKIGEGVAYAVTSFFLALYLIIDRDRMRGATFALVPREYHVRLSRIVLNLETIVGGYVRGQIITSLMMAVFTFIVLKIAGVPNAIALAAFAGLVDVLPYIGAILACGPAVLAAWTHGTPTAIGVFVSLLVYQEFESRIIVPRIYGRALRLPAAIVLVSLLVGGALLGVLGALLALPIAAGIRMVVEELRFELPGEDADDTELRARDASGERAFERRAAGAPAEEAAAIASEIAAEQIKHEEAERTGDPTATPVTDGTPPP